MSVDIFIVSLGTFRSERAVLVFTVFSAFVHTSQPGLFIPAYIISPWNSYEALCWQTPTEIVDTQDRMA